MKVIKVKKLPGTKGIMLFPFILVETEGRSERAINITINHEKIHYHQAKELFVIGFYLYILYEYIIKGYKNSRLENECYTNQYDLEYLNSRKNYAWKSDS